MAPRNVTSEKKANNFRYDLDSSIKGLRWAFFYESEIWALFCLIDFQFFVITT